MTKIFTVEFPEDQFHTLSNLLQLIVVAGLEFNGSGSAIPTKEQLAEVWRTLITARFTSHVKAASMEPKKIEAPWTDEQVANLNLYQQRGLGHPFTGERLPDGREVILIATNAGWIKKEGGSVIQTWAWEFMAKKHFFDNQSEEKTCPSDCDHKYNKNCVLSCYDDNE